MADYIPGMTSLIDQLVYGQLLNPINLQKEAISAHGTNWQPLTLKPNEENDFISWLAQQSNKVGFELDPNDPNYDYRRAFKEGVSPQPSEHDAGRYHWPSGAPSGAWLKSPTHPTGWAESYMQKIGFDPGTQAAQWFGLIPRMVR